MRAAMIASILMLTTAWGVAWAAEPTAVLSGAKARNNLVTELLDVAPASKPDQSFAFTRPDDGWVFLAATPRGPGTVRIALDGDVIASRDAAKGESVEAMRHLARGEHRVRVECTGGCRVERLGVRSIPELMHCGLGFDPAIKSYGRYDMEFLKRDILPNVTTLVVPSNITLAQPVIDGWHRQGKTFVAEVGINAQATTADEHYRFWAGHFDRSPFLDGILVNEFIVNEPSARPGRAVSPERAARVDRERQRYRVYGEAVRRLRADDRHRGKRFYG
jgi:hypothetical protein